MTEAGFYDIPVMFQCTTPTNNTDGLIVIGRPVSLFAIIGKPVEMNELLGALQVVHSYPIHSGHVLLFPEKLLSHTCTIFEGM